MRRRAFIRCLATLPVGVVPPATSAEPDTRVRRLGYLSPGAPDSPEEVRQQYALLSTFGWTERSLLFERRYANGRAELLPALAEDLVRLQVDAIVTSGTAATLAAKGATQTIPIVFWSAGAPVRSGLVASLAHPGGNVTGYTTVQPEIDGKRLQMLRDLVPSVQRVGVLENAGNPYFREAREHLELAARSLGMQPIFVEVAAAGELTSAVAGLARRGGQAMLVGPDDLFTEHRVRLMQAALDHSLPTTVSRLYIRETGALISYASVETEHDARVAKLIDRVLRGARPADLPIEQPSRFVLAINLKTAQALGLTVPPSLLLRADEIIR